MQLGSGSSFPSSLVLRALSKGREQNGDFLFSVVKPESWCSLSCCFQGPCCSGGAGCPSDPFRCRRRVPVDVCLSQGFFPACPGSATLRAPFPHAAEELAGSGSAIPWKMLQGLPVLGGKCCWVNKAVFLLPSLLCYAHGEEEEEEQGCHMANTGTGPSWGSSPSTGV